jgi:hypothetical protein
MRLQKKLYDLENTNRLEIYLNGKPVDAKIHRRIGKRDQLIAKYVRKYGIDGFIRQFGATNNQKVTLGLLFGGGKFGNR